MPLERRYSLSATSLINTNNIDYIEVHFRGIGKASADCSLRELETVPVSLIALSGTHVSVSLCPHHPVA